MLNRIRSDEAITGVVRTFFPHTIFFGFWIYDHCRHFYLFRASCLARKIRPISTVASLLRLDLTVFLILRTLDLCFDLPDDGLVH